MKEAKSIAGPPPGAGAPPSPFQGDGLAGSPCARSIGTGSSFDCSAEPAEPSVGPIDEPDDEEDAEIAAGDLRHMLRFLAPFARPYRASLAALTGTILAETAFNISFPLVERHVLDAGLIGHDWSVVVWTI